MGTCGPSITTLCMMYPLFVVLSQTSQTLCSVSILSARPAACTRCSIGTVEPRVYDRPGNSLRISNFYFNRKIPCADAAVQPELSLSAALARLLSSYARPSIHSILVILTILGMCAILFSRFDQTLCHTTDAQVTRRHAQV